MHLHHITIQLYTHTKRKCIKTRTHPNEYTFKEFGSSVWGPAVEMKRLPNDTAERRLTRPARHRSPSLASVATHCYIFLLTARQG